jgi:hypothetical protein
LLISLDGSGNLADQHFSKAQTWFVPAHGPAVEIVSDNAEWLLTYNGAEPPLKLRVS